MIDFWDKIAQGFFVDDCWLWRGKVGADGYGIYGRRRAHRVAYESSGKSATGLVVRHTCDTPLCCNPRHLVAGSHADNVLDRVSRGRSAVGEKNGNAKLTEKIVERIRNDRRAYSVIARVWGVGWTTIDAIKRGKSWRHLRRKSQ